MSTKKTSAMDVYVGARLKEARVIGGLSQDKLGGAVGLTFQQIQKYERGLNRISAVRLYEFAKILDLEITYFYDGIEIATESSSSQRANTESLKAESETLLKAYSKIEDPSVRKTVLSMIRSLREST